MLAISAVISTFFGPIDAIAIGMSWRSGLHMRRRGLPRPEPPFSSDRGRLKTRPSWVTLSPDHTLRQISMTSRVMASGLVNGTPCQPSITCGPDEPRPRTKRPSDRVSMVIADWAMRAGVRL